MELREKAIENLKNARKKIDFADHMTYITFPIIKENRLLIKILLEIHKALSLFISGILQYENYYKRIRLYKEHDNNFKTFIRISAKYDISEQEISKIKEIFLIVKKHKSSAFEFTKSGKFIIMLNSQTISVSLEKIKEYLNSSKNIIKKVENKIKET